jgi:hypothetical protein
MLPELVKDQRKVPWPYMMTSFAGMQRVGYKTIVLNNVA